MSLEEVTDKIVKYLPYLGIGILAVNQLGVHTLAFLCSLMDADERTKIKVDEEKLSKYVNLPSELDSVDYLILSSMLTHNFSKGVKDHCVECSSSVFSTYQKLIKQNNRKDLLKKVRFVYGRDENVGHEWLEFKQNGYFRSFECTIEIPPISENLMNKDKIREVISSHYMLSSENKIAYGKSLPSGNFYIPTIRGLFSTGLIGNIIQGRKYQRQLKQTS